MIIPAILMAVLFLSLPCHNTAATRSDGSVTVKQSSSSKRGSRLTGLNKVVYDEIESFIIDIAAGKRWNTSLTIDSDALKDVIQEEYTAKDLGVTSILKNGNITDQALKALMKKLNYNLDLTMNSLLADHPYELFWFDKTVNIISNWYKNGNTSIPCDYGKNFNNQDVLIPDRSIILSFSVSEDYMDGENRYRIDRSTIQTTKTAAANAAKIRDKYLNKTDEEKLEGYCREICKLTSYNTNPNQTYGNPWQMIWVFDKNSKTNVQCEGYAKAFQYLCSITTFNSDISCSTVTGKINGSKNHMWNIIKMGNGKKYMADITNCDGSLYYFLAGCKSGSVSKGYTYRLNNKKYTYTYDKDTLSIYSNNELTMSPSYYVTAANKNAKVIGIYLNGISHKIAGGKKIKLSAVIEPAYASNKKLQWKSSNNKYASVTQKGLVKTKKRGIGHTVIITARAKDGSGKSKSWKIRIMKGIVKSIKIKNAKKTLKAGNKMKLKAVVKSSKKANRHILWISNNSSYATVSQTGIVTAKNAGKGHTVKITAKATDGSGRKKIKKITIK